MAVPRCRQCGTLLWSVFREDTDQRQAVAALQLRLPEVAQQPAEQLLALLRVGDQSHRGAAIVAA